MRAHAKVRLFILRWGKPIEFISKIAQAIAIILGVGFAVNEFVLKNRAAENDKVKLSLELAAKSGSEGVQRSRKDTKAFNEQVLRIPRVEGENDQVSTIAWEYYEPATAELRAYYRTVTSCVLSGACSRPVLLLILCDDAKRNETLLDEIQNRVGSKHISDSDRADIRTFLGWCAASKRGPT